MIGDRDRRMTEVCGAAHQISRFGDGVHLAHIGMQVQFNTFLRRVIHYLYLFYGRDRACVDDGITREFIKFRVAGDDNG